MIKARLDRLFASFLGAAAALGVAAGAARGDVVVAEWNNFLDFQYTIDHLPDIDQRRAALPNDGNMYCVPTSCINLAAYFATHGDPSVPPGLQNWQSQANYDTMTGQLMVLGLLMSTNANDGTTGSNGLSGLASWLSQSDELYLAFRYARDGDWAPKLNNIAHHAIQGALVAPCIGWYDITNFPFIDRDGGHCMSLVTASRLGEQMFVSISDPASADGDLDVQSPFTFETYGVQNEVVNPSLAFITMSKMLGYASGNTRAYFDSMYVIYPGFMLSTLQVPNQFSWNFAHVPWGAPETIQQFTGPDASQILDLEMQADASAIFALLQQDGETGLWMVDPVTGDWTLVDVPLGNATRIHVNRMRDVYVVDGADIACIAVDPEVPEELIRVTPPVAPTTITSNDLSNQIAVLTPISFNLYPYGLDADPEVIPLPNGVPDLTDGGGFIHDPSRDAYWVVSPTEDALFFLREDGEGGLIMQTYGHDTLIAPEAVDVDDTGRLYVSTMGAIMEYAINAEDVLEPVADPLYEGVEAGHVLQVARSRTNHDPALHEGPAWRNRLPDSFGGDSTPVCLADLNNDGVVDVVDLLQLISEWGRCPNDAFCEADINFSTAVDVADLLLMLSVWGDCN